MSTRAMYTFIDRPQADWSGDTFHVYKHHDGYPTGAAGFLTGALALAWELPRYEASDFAAAFVAANKTGGGSVYLMPSGTIEDVMHADLAYRYEISQGDDRALHVRAFYMYDDSNPTGKEIFDCPLAEFAARAEAYEKQAG